MATQTTNQYINHSDNQQSTNHIDAQRISQPLHQTNHQPPTQATNQYESVTSNQQTYEIQTTKRTSTTTPELPASPIKKANRQLTPQQVSQQANQPTNRPDIQSTSYRDDHRTSQPQHQTIHQPPTQVVNQHHLGINQPAIPTSDPQTYEFSRSGHSSFDGSKPMFAETLSRMRIWNHNLDVLGSVRPEKISEEVELIYQADADIICW